MLMDKESVLSWLAEVHRLQRRYKLEYPYIPAIGHFIMFTNEFRWDSECQREMLELGVASGLQFPDYMNRLRAFKSGGDSCGTQGELRPEGDSGGQSERNCSSWGHSPEHSSGKDSGDTLPRIATSESCASNAMPIGEEVFYSCF